MTAILPRQIKILFLLLGFVVCANANEGDLTNGIRLFEARKYAEAKTFFAEFIKTRPRHAAAAYYLGRIDFNHSDYDAAIKWLELAVEVEQNNALYHLWLGRACGRKAMRASVLKKPGLAKRAQGEFEHAVRLDPNNLEARSDLMEYYLQAPGIMGGSLDKARQQAQEIKNRSAFDGHRAQARIHEDQKELAPAEAEYRAAIKNFPDSLRAYFQLNSFYLRQKKYDQAVALANEMIEKFPARRKENYVQLGLVYLQMQQYDLALASMEKSIALDPEYWNGYLQIGRLGAVSGQHLARAEAALKMFIKNNPQGDNVPLAWAHVRLGMVYEHQKKKDLAAAEFNAALQLEPNLEEAKKALKRVK